MVCELEDELERRIRAGESARDVIAGMLARASIASPKQAWRTLEKWSGRGRYNWGVTLDLGWMEDP
jgi:hypothetical protein